MKRTMRMQRKTGSLPAAIAAGIALCLIVTIAGAAITAQMIEKEMLQEKMMGYGAMVLLILSAWAGSCLAKIRTEGEKLLACMGTGLIYFVILLAGTVLFFDGKFSGVAVTALLIFCGSFLAFLPGLGKNKPGKGRKRKKAYR